MTIAVDLGRKATKKRENIEISTCDLFKMQNGQIHAYCMITCSWETPSE